MPAGHPLGHRPQHLHGDSHVVLEQTAEVAVDDDERADRRSGRDGRGTRDLRDQCQLAEELACAELGRPSCRRGRCPPSPPGARRTRARERPGASTSCRSGSRSRRRWWRSGAAPSSSSRRRAGRGTGARPSCPCAAARRESNRTLRAAFWLRASRAPCLRSARRGASCLKFPSEITSARSGDVA